MLKRKSPTLLFFILCSVFDIPFSFSQVPEIEWQITIGGDGTDLLDYVSQTSDGGYILGGSSNSDISGDKTEDAFGVDGTTDYWIVKLNPIGGIEWQNDIGGTNGDFMRSMQQTSDGGYILGGYSKSGISGDKTENAFSYSYDYWIVKLDSNGNIQWQNTIGGSSSDELSSIDQTEDGGYIIGGSSTSPISGDKTEGNANYDYWIVKLNSFGVIEWQNKIGGNSYDYLTSIEQTADGGFIIGGYSNSDSTGDKTEDAYVGGLEDDYWLVKVNAIGEIEWQNTIGGNDNDYLRMVNQTADGNYFLVGNSKSDISGDKTENAIGDGYDIYDLGCACYINNNNSDYWILKVDIFGNIIWENTIGGDSTETLNSFEETNDGGYILGGYSASGISGDKTEPHLGVTYTNDYWLVKINSTGAIEWQKTIGSSGDDFLNTVHQTFDGGFFLGGYKVSGFSADFLVYKLYPSGCDLLPETCNSLDDNCNGIIDEDVIESCSISAVGSPVICPGESVMLNAIYSGTSVQWKKNGYPIPGATTSSYTTSSKGFYSCTSYSDCDTIISNVIFVNSLKGPPAAITAGGPTTFCDGGSVVLTANTGIGLSYQWYKGGTPLAGATSINYTATIAGNYKCKVTKFFTGCINYSNVISVSVPCKEDEWSVVNVESGFTIYPNPANDKLNIQIESQLLSPSSFLLIITDIEGRIIFTSLLNSPTTEINISDFASGMYFVKIKMNEEEMIEKFIKN